ncbi:ABC transporter ATP-binding protein [Coprococcus catus]|uniref:ABC transporter ATP-binding protein n=1 Tax=Coprococcus catus TaxID=116085 RepID=UPI001C8C7E8E|nr:ABC transporter ATP-binding protein [Coprococcus catus]MBX9230833.1 ABC transporter ATP-binding protein [Coprococcus catus]MCT6799852.1 ABC transporter ATP-binding protein [Coprococcus catus]
MSENILTVKDLKTYFYTASGVAKAVDGVSFNIAKGETMGIVGESGSGKSVTSSSIIRLLPPRTGKIVGGSIEFEGKDVLALSKKELNDFRGKDIAVVFQDPMTSLDPVFKIGKQMTEMIMAHQNVTKDEAWKMAVEALNKVGIPEPEKRMNSYPYELSGGMCQRVIIAMAVCCKPKLIIADEPTTALDVTVQAQVLELLKDLQRNMDTAILLITHNLGVVWEMCDKVMVMYAGNTVEFTDTKTLYSNPCHPYTWGLLDSMPKLSDESKGELKTIPGTPPDLRLTGKCCNFYNRCPYVTEACTQSVPPLVEVEPGHFVACHRQNLTNKLEKGEGLKDE